MTYGHIIIERPKVVIQLSIYDSVNNLSILSSEKYSNQFCTNPMTCPGPTHGYTNDEWLSLNHGLSLCHYCICWQVMSKLCSPQTAVTVLTTSSAADYKSPLVSSDLPLSFLRYLKSNKCSTQVICPPLEQPNIISGLSAQSMVVIEHYWKITN